MPGFEEWAVVELMGHQRIAGKVTEATIGGGAFIRVDVPDVQGVAGYTRFIAPGAVYAINPCSEEVARRAAEYTRAQPVRSYELAPALPAGSASPSPTGPDHCDRCGARLNFRVQPGTDALCARCASDDASDDVEEIPSPPSDGDGKDAEAPW